MEERWVEVRKGGDFNGISRKFGINPLTARLIRNREVVGDDAIRKYLHGGLVDLYDGMLLKDMDKAVDILKEKIQLQKCIRVIGDYDIDGVNATYILLQGLRHAGAICDSDIPERIRDGFGLNMRLVERAVHDGIDTIITCDNGVKAMESILYAKEQGLTVIVTDHHDVHYKERSGANGVVREYIYPEADAIVNPKRPDCTYPFKELCGAAVAYKVVECLIESMGQDAEDVDYLIENVALATVGDIMNLVDENRIFVKQGLEMLGRTKNPGLRALIEKTVKNETAISAYHLGFVIGPCINACGRLETAKKALELLVERDEHEAAQRAEELKVLNEKRQVMQEKELKEAKRIVEEELQDDRVLVVYLPNCHESLAGIIAGRLRDAYYKPAFVVTPSEEGEKGSARSIEAYPMGEALNKCESLNPGLFIRQGGHTLAAGFSLYAGKVEEFRRKLNELCQLTKEDLIEKVPVDMLLSVGQVSEAMIEELSLIQPCGKGNRTPHFATEVEVTNMQIFGKIKKVVKMRLLDASQKEIEGIYFGDHEELQGYIVANYGETALESILKGRRAGVKLAVIFSPKVNEFNGTKTLQFAIQRYR